MARENKAYAFVQKCYLDGFKLQSSSDIRLKQNVYIDRSGWIIMTITNSTDVIKWCTINS